jgi:hypothetical protein
VALTAIVPAVASFAITDEQARFAAILASVVATVAGGIAWMDKRIKTQIQEHAEYENRADGLRHQAYMAEFRHLKELLKR